MAPAPDCPPAPNAGTEPLYDLNGPRMVGLTAVPSTDLPDFTDDMDRETLVLSFSRSLDYWAALPPGRKVSVGGRTFTASHMRRSVAALLQVVQESASSAELLRRLRAEFDVFASVGSDGKGGTVTGYFDAALEASLQPSAERPFPVHARPADLVRLDPALGSPFDYGRVDERGRVVPHFSRAEVSAGALAGRGLERFFVAHPTDLLVLQTEGSGVITLPDGAKRRVAFDGANGWPFRSVGRELIRCGLLPPDATGSRVLDWLKSQPPERESRLVDLNPRTVYFKESSAPGAHGAMGALLTPGRSIAVDPAFVPLGSAALLVSKRPLVNDDGEMVGTIDFARLAAAQDTGSAIRGPGRVDLFFGGGRKAEGEARGMFYPGRLFVLVLK